MAENQVKKHGAQYKTFSIFILINNPVVYLFEVYSKNHLTTNLWIRSIPVILCLAILFKDKWPERSKKFIPLFWYLTVMISIPVLGSYMLFKNNFSFEWLNNFNLGIVVMLCLLDLVSFLILELIGFLLGVLIFYLSGNVVYSIPDHQYFTMFFYTLMYIVILGAIFTRNKEIYNDYLQRSKDELNAHLEQKILERTKELEYALAAKTEFLNNMSHEIRTPVTGFLNISEGLYDRWDSFDNTKRYEYMGVIKSAAKRLASLIGGLLDLSKFSAGKMRLDIFQVDMNRAIENMLDECNVLYLANKKLELKFTNYVDSANIKADEERVGQVLRNLFVNAIKFSPENSVIEVFLHKSTLAYNNNSKVGCVYFTVSDQGIGIPDGELEEIFQPFIQSTRTKTKAGGTGLGLSIVREIIAAHHGKVWATNNDTRGATFHVIIPIEHDNSLENSNISFCLENSVEISGVVSNNNINKASKSLKILMIDDDELCVRSMSMIMSQTNHDLVIAMGGVEGLKYLNENTSKVDLILLDLMMPDIYGINVLEKIKENPQISNIPVILQSGTGDIAEINRAYNLGIVANLHKPYQPKQVIMAIDKVVAA
jgi:two-component system sensor histidine kinase ChiS